MRTETELLAIDGGKPVRTDPFPFWPHYDEDEITAVQNVLRSGKVNYWTGEQGRLFESEFAAFTETRHAIALANGTVALELALYALGIGQGDEVIVPCRTFIASASAAVMRGAKPVVADVDLNSQNITAQNIAAVLSSKTKAIITVHLSGWPCDMDPILELARERGIYVIEDCAQAHGALYRGRPVGSIGDIGTFSFCQDKIITPGGEGGMLVTNRRDLWEKAWAFKDHGKSFEAVYHREHPPGFRWLHESFGTNWRLTEMQSAIGRIQLRKLPTWLDIRTRNAAILTERLSPVRALRIPTLPPDIRHSFYKYYVFVKTDLLKPGWDRNRIQAALEKEGIPVFYGSCSEIYLEKAFEADSLRPESRLPAARELGDTSLMFPVHPTLTEKDMNDMADAVLKVMRVATQSLD